MNRILIVVLLLYLGVSCFAAFEEETVLLYLFDEETADEATDLSEFEGRLPMLNGQRMEKMAVRWFSMVRAALLRCHITTVSFRVAMS